MATKNETTRLVDLGTRICILGQSGSGKSTLAAAIGESRGLRVVHLDQYRHLPGTQWELRPDDEFSALHAAAVTGDRWVMDGNYSKLLPQRLTRATGLILLDISTMQSLYQYTRRTLGRRSTRIGGLEGTKDTLSPAMISFTLKHTQANRRRRRDLYDSLALPKIVLPGRSALRHFYRQERLRRPEN